MSKFMTFKEEFEKRKSQMKKKYQILQSLVIYQISWLFFQIILDMEVITSKK